MPRMRDFRSTRNPRLGVRAGRACSGQVQDSKLVEDRRRNEARARCVDVAVAPRRLAVRIEALRHDEVQRVPGPRHRDVEQPPLLVDLVLRAGAEIGRNAAVDDVEHEHVLPFLALGRMDGGEDQVVLVEMRRAGAVAGRVRRIEREIGQEALARGIAGGDLLELHEVGAAHGGVLVDALQMRLVPEADIFEIGRPAADLRAQPGKQLDESRPVGLGPLRRTKRRQPDRRDRASPPSPR